MAKKFTEIIKGLVLRNQTSDPSDNISGSVWYNSTVNKLKGYINSAIRVFVTEDDSQTLTNKTIDLDNNTLSNIEVDNLKSGVLDTDLTTVSLLDDTIPSAKATKAYADFIASTASADLSTHLNDTVDAHDASAISYINTTSGLTATQVQAALDEVDGNIDTVITNLTNHINSNNIHNTAFGNQALLESQSGTSITGLIVNNYAARILIYVSIDATTDIYEVFDILALKKGGSYAISVLHAGDSSNIVFGISGLGTLTYDSGTFAGFVSGNIRWTITNLV